MVQVGGGEMDGCKWSPTGRLRHQTQTLQPSSASTSVQPSGHCQIIYQELPVRSQGPQELPVMECHQGEASLSESVLGSEVWPCPRWALLLAWGTRRHPPTILLPSNGGTATLSPRPCACTSARLAGPPTTSGGLSVSIS